MSSELTNSSSKKHSNPLNTDFSKITSYPMLESIIKTLSNPGVVQMAIRHYANFPETTVGKEGFTSRRSNITEVLRSIDDNRTFMLSYPAVIEEFYLTKKNPYNADSTPKFGYSNKTIPKSMRVPEIGVPINGADLLNLIARTYKIVSAFFNDGDSTDFTPDTTKSRSFFEQCFALCDADATLTESIRLKMRDLDTLLISGPKKMLSAPGEESNITTDDIPKPVVQDSFLEREFNFKNASEWKILKELRSMPAQEYNLHKRVLLKANQAVDIANSIADIYETRILEFIENAKMAIKSERFSRLRGHKLPIVSKWDYSKKLIPVNYLDPWEQKGEAGYSSQKKGEYTACLLNNYLDEVRKKIWEFSDEAGRTEFSRIITKRMSVYFPYDVVYFAFLKRPWALDVAKELDVDIEALTEVRISRMDVDISIAETLADENASKLLKEIKTAKSEDTAGLFAKYSEYGLFHSDKNSRKEKNELSGIVDENTLKQAYYNEHSIKPESSFGNYPSDKFAVRFYGNPKVAEAFEIHLSGKDTRDSIFPEVVTVPDSNESVRFAFLAGLGNGTYRDDIRAPYIKGILGKKYASWDEAVKVARVLSGTYKFEAPKISEFLLSIPHELVTNKKFLVYVYSMYFRSSIDDILRERVKEIFFSTDEGKLVSTLLESGAMNESGLKSVLEVFVKDCEASSKA